MSQKRTFILTQAEEMSATPLTVSEKEKTIASFINPGKYQVF